MFVCVCVMCWGGQSIFLYICMTEQLCTLDRFTQRAGIGEPCTFPAFSPSQKTIAPLLNIATATFVPFLFRLLEPLSHTCACLCKILYGFPACPLMCLSVHLLNMRSPIFLFYVHKCWDVQKNEELNLKWFGEFTDLFYHSINFKVYELIQVPLTSALPLQQPE